MKSILEYIQCFRGLQNYTTLKLPDALSYVDIGFRGLQNYTTLKRRSSYLIVRHGFRGLQNYTTLKLFP